MFHILCETEPQNQETVVFSRDCLKNKLWQENSKNDSYLQFAQLRGSLRTMLAETKEAWDIENGCQSAICISENSWIIKKINNFGGGTPINWREEEVRRVRMPAWILKCVTGPCDPKGAWETSMGFDMLTGATGSHCPSSHIRETTPLGRWKPASQVPKECQKSS